MFTWLRGYRAEWFRADLVAGLTVWAILVPEALAYATIAGVSPVVGLYAAPGALILYAAFASSKHVITGPMAATAALSAAAIAEFADGGSGAFLALTTALALVVGLLAVAAGLLRLGFLAGFISEPVLKGFIVGLALTIAVGQVPKLFGIDAGSGNFFEQLASLVANLRDTDPTTLLVGAGSLGLVLLLRRLAPVVPGSLVAVIAGILAVALLGLDERGVRVVGEIDRGLPSLGLPTGVAVGDYVALLGSAGGIMLIGFAESLGAAKNYAVRFHYDVDANRELLGLGAANLASGLSGGMVVNGSLSKTAVNTSAGARTQASSIIVAVLTVLTLLFLTGLFEQLPEATLAAVVIAAVVELIDVPALVDLYRLYTRRLGRVYGWAARPDFIAATAALLGVLILDTLPGLFIGIGLSLLLLLYRASRPHIAELGKVPGTPDQYADLDRHPQNRAPAGITVLRVESGLFFGNADAVRQALRQHARQDDVRVVVVDAGSVPFIDVTAVRMLDELAADLRRSGIQLALAGDLGQVRDLIRLEVHDDAALLAYPTIQAAVDDLTVQE
ncbi:MAG TPA: SulP family inorganic anion transporter [Euzebyales bacterium]|nr:SulP family inorganic anion transporter [Euzebyales bacterium]